MPAHSTFPTLFDDVKQISISKLKEWDYFNAEGFKSGRLVWSRRGQEIGSISLSVDTRKDTYCTLSYTVNKDEHIKYRVDLDTVPSNLGVGKIWYFVCPHTGKRCRKLYGAGKYFLHRDAYPNAMYETQTYSEFARKMNRVFDSVFGTDKYYETLYSKHFKKYYAGKPTKRYQKILNKLDESRMMESEALAYFR